MSNYVQLLATKLSNFLNSVQFKTAMSDEKCYTFHRKGENAKTLNVPTLANRSVTLNLKDSEGNTKPTKITSKQGSMAISKPAQEGVMFSFAHEVYDMEVTGSITDLTLNQEMDTLIQSMDSSITQAILKTINESPNKAKYVREFPAITVVNSSIRTLAEAVQEAIFMAKFDSIHLGQELNDYVIGVSSRAYTMLEFQAKTQGFKTVSEMMETEVFPFDSVDTNNNLLQGYLIPKRHCAVSFSEPTNGHVFKTTVTRIAERQSNVMEITADAQLLIAGFTKLTVPTNGTAGIDVEVPMPLVTHFSVKTA